MKESNSREIYFLNPLRLQSEEDINIADIIFQKGIILEKSTLAEITTMSICYYFPVDTGIAEVGVLEDVAYREREECLQKIYSYFYGRKIKIEADECKEMGYRIIGDVCNISTEEIYKIHPELKEDPLYQRIKNKKTIIVSNVEGVTYPKDKGEQQHLLQHAKENLKGYRDSLKK